MDKIIKDYLLFRKKKVILEIASKSKSIAGVLRDFEVPKSTFYKWKKAYETEGDAGLKRKKPIASTHPKKIKAEVVEKVLQIRKDHKMGSWRIKWYLERYHGICISESSVTRILRKNGVGRLSKTASKRTLHSKRYSKKTPGHHVQMDVKFIHFVSDKGQKIRRFQYTAIDDATRIRALKIYSKHSQANAIDFVNFVVEKFPFRINTIRTDRGHEFQAKFHWHVEDMGMRHHYIKPRSPYLNGKVERSHRTDQNEFYQLISYTDDVDLNKKLEHWEQFYNYHRSHSALNGKTPYETLKCILDK